MTKNTRLSTPAQLQCSHSRAWEPWNEAKLQALFVCAVQSDSSPCIYGIAILTSASKTSSPYLLLSVLRMSKRQSSVSCKNFTTSSPRIHMTFVRTTFRSLFPWRHLRRRRSSTEGKEMKEGGRRGGEKEFEGRRKMRGGRRRGERKGGEGKDDNSYYIIIQLCPYTPHPHTLTHTCLGEFGRAG